MRNGKMFLACAAVATVGLSAATPAMATFCTQPIGVQISVVTPVLGGPPEGAEAACQVKEIHKTNPQCSSQGDWTGIKYQVEGPIKSTDLISTLVTANNNPYNDQIYVAAANGFSFYSAGSSNGGGGDTNTGLGKYSAHEQAVRVKLATNNGLSTFWVLVRGNKQPLPTSIAIKRGSYCPIKTFKVLGLGLDLPEGCVSSCGNFSAAQALTSKEIVKFKDCEYQFTKDLTTGAILEGEAGFSLVSGSCDVFTGSVSELNISGGQLGSQNVVSFGDGFVSSGEESCNTRFVAGRYYTVCTP